jgi:hypothetical protein
MQGGHRAHRRPRPAQLMRDLAESSIFPIEMGKNRENLSSSSKYIKLINGLRRNREVEDGNYRARKWERNRQKWEISGNITRDPYLA